MLFLNHAAIVGGSEIDLLDLARHRGQGSSVLLFSEGPLVGMLRRAEVPVEVIPTRWATAGRRAQTTRPTPASLVEIARLVARVVALARRHDVIFANSQKALLVAALAAPLARRPVVTMLHELLVPAHFSAWNVRLNVFLANRARRVIANSHATAAALRDAGGRTDHLAVVSPGLDPGRFAAAPADIVSARRALGLPEGFLVGHFGRVTPWKGQHVLVEALGATPDASAIVVGAAEEEDRAYLRSLQDRARATGVSDRIRFLGLRNDVPRLLHLVDVVAHTSTDPEPFGRVIVEAMLAGRPVVATHGGGVGELVEDGVTGLLVPPGDGTALAAAWTRLRADPALAARLAAAGRADALARHGLDRMLAETDRLVEEACEP